MESKIDFSALERLNMPPINIEAKDLEAVDGQPLLSKDEIEDAKESAIEEVNGIHEFSTTEEDTEDSENNGESAKKEQIEAETSNDDDEDSEGTEVNTEESSVISAVAEWAKAKGIFDYEPDQFEDSEDWLENKLLEKSKSYAEEWKESLPPIIKEVINNYEEGVPLDELIYSKSREMEYHSVAEEELGKSDGLQKKLVADWLYTQDFSDEEIESKIKKYEDALILEDEAKTALKKLKVYEAKYQEQLKYETERKKMAMQENYNQMLKQIESDIMSSEEIIPGIQLSKEEKKKVYDAYTKQDSSRKTQLMKALESDPQAWYKITQFMVLMNGNLKDVEKKLTTKATKKVKETVNTYKETPGLGKLTSPSSLKAMKKAIEKIKKTY